MSNADQLLLIFFGMAVGGALSYFATWSHARKVEDLVDGGLKAWDDYDRQQAQAKGEPFRKRA